MVVVAPVGEHVARVGNRLHFNGAGIEVHPVPGVGARHDGVDADVSGPVGRGVQRHGALERQVEAFNQMDARGGDPLGLPQHHVVQGVVPCVHPRGGSPARDVLGHGSFNLARHGPHACDECLRQQQGVDQIGVPVHEPVSEGRIVQHVVKEVAVHRRRTRVACVLEVVLPNRLAKVPQARVRVVQDVPPSVRGRGLEDLGVVQPPSDAHPVHVLEESLEDEVVHVALRIERLREGVVESRAGRGSGQQGIARRREFGGVSRQGAQGVEQGDFLRIGPKMCSHVVLVRFFPCAVQPPVVPI